MNERQQLFLLWRTHWRVVWRRLLHLCGSRRLTAATLAVSLLGYMVGAYELFRQGLIYLGRMPGASGILTDRLLHIAFFCLFFMLAFSTAVTAYISLFRSRETTWLFGLPLTHRVIFLWKVIETTLYTGWGLLMLSAPLLLAFAHHRGAGLGFYLKSGLGMVLFMVVACLGAGCVLLLLVRCVGRRQLRWGMVLISGITVSWLVREYFNSVKIVEHSTESISLAVQGVLRHTEVTTHWGLPSTWLAEGVSRWSLPFRRQGEMLNGALLLSHALLGALCASLLGKWLFFDAWNRTVQREAAILPDADQSGRRYTLWQSRKSTSAWPPFWAIARKDVVTFVREPSQWVQFALVFGLLGLYALNIRRFNPNLEAPRDVVLIASFNVAACAFALSTLTTRFVYPQFSLDGRRLWILAMAPIRLEKLVLQKYLLALGFTGSIACLILFLSGRSLHLPASEVLWYVLTMAFLAIGLNGLAVGLGVVLPNVSETNSARIVSGFGGTVCLIASVIYVVGIIGLAVVGRFAVFGQNRWPEGLASTPEARWSLVGMVLMASAAALVPTWLAKKRLKKLEISSNMEY